MKTYLAIARMYSGAEHQFEIYADDEYLAEEAAKDILEYEKVAKLPVYQHSNLTVCLRPSRIESIILREID